MGAATTVLLTLARPGATVALAEGAYFGTGTLFRRLEPWGVRLVEYAEPGPPPPADLVWVEAPANPILTEPDWDAVRAHPAPVVCDATVSTPIYLKGLDEGADVVLHSATKFLTGHHNALLGATVTRNPNLSEGLRRMRTLAGIAASP